ncbi:MAG: SGNH/GDSL hydrolase family protein [Bacteroidota bacterium]|nr:SGNH/GDSL hydrolase family protein [Bacteroidota bacterium]
MKKKVILNRYVPKILGDWDNTLNTEYDALSVVTYNYSSYTSSQFVPKGIDITNEDFWICTGNYNAELENFKNDTNSQLSAITPKVNANTTAIANIGSATPKGVYPTLSALQTAFPTGASGVYVNTADGKWYWWNGTAWTAGGTYQSMGISNGIIRKQKLDNLIQPLFVESGYIDLNMPLANFIMGTVANYNGTLVASSGQGYCKFTVNGGDKIIFSGRNSQWTPLLVVTDLNNSLIQTYPTVQPGSAGDTQNTNVVLTLPDNAVNVYFNILNTTYALPTAKILSNIDLNFTSKKISRIDLSDTLKNMFGDNFSTIPVTFTDGSYISKANVLTTYAGYSYAILTPKKGDKYRISGMSYFAIKPYVLVNPDGTVNTFAPSADDSSETYTTNLIIEVPYDGCKLVLNSKNIRTTVVEKVNSYTISTNLGNKWAVIGDSWTEKNSNATIKYHDLISQQLGFTVYNMGVSGTGFKATEGSNTAYYQRISSIPTDTEVVTIMGSGNDSSYVTSGQLGTYTDTGTNTLCGCINKTIDNLLAVIPTIKFGIITPGPWQNAQPSDGTSTQMSQISAAIVQICNYRGIPCLDLFHNSLLRPNDATFKSLAYNSDGVHPNNAGHSIIAPRIRKFVKSLI